MLSPPALVPSYAVLFCDGEPYMRRVLRHSVHHITRHPRVWTQGLLRKRVLNVLFSRGLVQTSTPQSRFVLQTKKELISNPGSVSSCLDWQGSHEASEVFDHAPLSVKERRINPERLRVVAWTP